MPVVAELVLPGPLNQLAWTPPLVTAEPVLRTGLAAAMQMAWIGERVRVVVRRNFRHSQRVTLTATGRAYLR